jgi:hypothetical protein
MEQGFIDILKKLIDEQGKEALLNSAKCKAFLADYTKNEYKKESRLLLQALDVGVQRAIDTTKEIAICKKQQIRLLHEDYGLDEKIAADIVDTLALILRGDTSKSEPDSVHIPLNIKSELKDLLSYIDQLFESLPEDKIEEFARSKYFDSYKKIFKELKLV